jgi:serine/threonine protein kinase
MIGIQDPNRVAISPIYAAPELFIDVMSVGSVATKESITTALSFDVFSIAILYCQLLFQYLDERTESAFRQQLASGICNYNIDLWLQYQLNSKVRKTRIEDSIQILYKRYGLWKLLQDMLQVNPKERITSQQALQRWNNILQYNKQQLNSATTTVVDVPKELDDGVFIREIFQSLIEEQNEECIITDDTLLVDTETTELSSAVLEFATVPTVWPLHYVATFNRAQPLGLILSEANTKSDDDNDNDDDEYDSTKQQQWDLATVNARPGEVFVKDIVPYGQADTIGIIAIGDRLHGVGELPLLNGGFQRAVELVRTILKVGYRFVFDS